MKDAFEELKKRQLAINEIGKKLHLNTLVRKELTLSIDEKTSVLW